MSGGGARMRVLKLPEVWDHARDLIDMWCLFESGLDTTEMAATLGAVLYVVARTAKLRRAAVLRNLERVFDLLDEFVDVRLDDLSAHTPEELAAVERKESN